MCPSGSHLFSILQSAREDHQSSCWSCQYCPWCDLALLLSSQTQPSSFSSPLLPYGRKFCLWLTWTWLIPREHRISWRNLPSSLESPRNMIAPTHNPSSTIHREHPASHSLAPNDETSNEHLTWQVSPSLSTSGNFSSSLDHPPPQQLAPCHLWRRLWLHWLLPHPHLLMEEDQESGTFTGPATSGVSGPRISGASERVSTISAMARDEISKDTTHKAPGLIASQTLTKLKSVPLLRIIHAAIPKRIHFRKSDLKRKSVFHSMKSNNLENLKTDRHWKSQIKQVQWKNSGHKFPLACSHSISAVSFIPNTNTFPFVTGRASIGLQKKLTSFIVSCRAGIGFQQGKPTPFGNSTKAKGKHAQ